jgi:hypothetical protein
MLSPHLSEGGPAAEGYISSVFRRLIPMFAASALLLSACGQSAPPTPALDANQIITKGLEATTALQSFHLDVALDGQLTLPQLGGIRLSDSTLAGDFDVAGKLAHLTFSLPKLFGLAGEIIATEQATYIKSTLTGAKWQKQDASTPGGSIPEVQDPTKALAELGTFLKQDGVEARKLADASCGDANCYQVELTMPSALLDDAVGAAGSSASEIIGDALVLNLQFDREKLYLTTVSTSIDNTQAGTFSATMSLSGFDQPLTISEPPASDVDTSGGGFSLP